MAFMMNNSFSLLNMSFRYSAMAVESPLRIFDGLNSIGFDFVLISLFNS